MGYRAVGMLSTRSMSTTSAPSRADAMACARPCPRAPPLIKTTCSSSNPTTSPFARLPRCKPRTSGPSVQQLAQFLRHLAGLLAGELLDVPLAVTLLSGGTAAFPTSEGLRAREPPGRGVAWCVDVDAAGLDTSEERACFF